jgi:SAM-dependent methyltransferase
MVFDVMRRATSPRVRGWIKKNPLFLPVSKRLFGTGVYGQSYFNDIERIEAASVPVIAEWIVRRLSPTSVIDIGCGPGHQMKALVERGVRVFGVDIADAALAMARAKGLSVERFDLTSGARLPGGPYDLVLSCEVAEHLEEKHAGAFVDHCVSAGSVVYLTAAEPSADGTTGLHHFNERPNAYWVGLFRERGWVLDEALTAEARAAFAGSGVISYLAKPMVLRRG